MSRTQIYLGSEELEILDRVAARTGASRSELVRRAIRTTYGERSKEDRLRAITTTAGSWRERSFDGSQYVGAIRGDLNERLTRLGLS